MIKEVTIEEFKDYYLVKIIDKCDKKLSVQYIKQEKDIVSLIEMFLKIGRVNKVFNKLPVVKKMVKSNNDYVLVHSVDNDKILKIMLYNRKFKYMYDMIIDKYSMDRYEFLKSKEVTEIRLFSGCEKFMYEEVDGCVNIMLCTDNNKNIVAFENDFMKEYLYDIFSSIGDIVTVEFVLEQAGKSHECVVKCGNFRMYFPQNYTFSTIVGIVNNYNNRINKIKKK